MKNYVSEILDREADWLMAEIRTAEKQRVLIQYNELAMDVPRQRAAELDGVIAYKRRCLRQVEKALDRE